LSALKSEMREQERNDVERDRGEKEVTQRGIDGDKERMGFLYEKRESVSGGEATVLEPVKKGGA
jgi:hypothetical protein